MVLTILSLFEDFFIFWEKRNFSIFFNSKKKFFEKKILREILGIWKKSGRFDLNKPFFGKKFFFVEISPPTKNSSQNPLKNFPFFLIAQERIKSNKSFILQAKKNPTNLCVKRHFGKPCLVEKYWKKIMNFPDLSS